MTIDPPLLMLGAGLLLVIGLWAVTHHYSREATLGRRRRRSHGRLEPKVNRPMVRLSVRTRKRK